MNRRMMDTLLQVGTPPGHRIPAFVAYNLRLSQAMIRAGESGEAVQVIQAAMDTIRTYPATFRDRGLPPFRNLLALARLKVAMDEICVRSGTLDSCHVPPLGDGTVTGAPEALKAASAYLELLEGGDGRDELTNRWLLNLSHMLAGDYPDGVGERWRIPQGAFAPEDRVNRFRDAAPELGLDLVGLAGGAALEDFDGDGDLDLMASSQGYGDQLRFFRNEGDGTFVERTSAAGLEGLTGGLNLKQADYDNDGDVDVLVLRGGWASEGWPNSLLRNRGDGTFEDVTASAGLLHGHPTQTAAWGDYDNDGDLDLYVGNEMSPDRGSRVHPSRLHRNRGDGTFEDVAPAAGVDVQGFVKGVDWGDYDDDGRLDLYVSRLGETNLLYRNEGPDEEGIWRFEEVSERAGVSGPEVSFPTWFFDYDNDGDLDLYVSSWQVNTSDVVAEYLGRTHEAEPPALYRNEGDGTFTEVTGEVGLDRPLYVMGSNYGDLDGDGYPDLVLGTGEPDMRAVLPTRVFRNHRGERFRDVTTAGGFGHLGKGHGVSFGDVDGDGDQDVYMVYGGAFEGDAFPNVLYENPGHGARWLTLRLRGREANRSGVGARIRVVVATPDGEREIHARAGSGGSFGANSLQQEIGLGAARSIRSVTIRWPGSGTVDRYRGVEMDRIYVAREGATELEPVSSSPAEGGP